MRLLVVDDNEEITEAIHFFCESKKDIECYMNNDGQQGLERIKQEKFDLILLDLSMPEFSGHDVIKSLKQDGVIESKNIVVFTASSNPKILNKIKNSGIKEVFKKPFTLDDITALIEKYRPIDRQALSITINSFKCNICKHVWRPAIWLLPKTCPRCMRPLQEYS